MGTRPARRAPWRALAVAVVVAASTLLGPPALAAGTTAVAGVVTDAGRAVAGVRVGTWDPARGTVASATTDSSGRFLLRTPSDVPVVAFAGAAPSARKAVFTAGWDRLVRGVIGAAAPRSAPSALAATTTRVRPDRLGDGRPLQFRLQRAGRFTASSPHLGASADVTGAVAIQHGDGLYGPEWSASAAGSLTSGWLVPGRYRLLWNPKPDVLPARTWVTVLPGATVVAKPPRFAVATTVRIAVTSGGRPVGAGVPVVEWDGDDVAAAPSTDATGTVVIPGVAPGVHQYTVGRSFDDPDEGLDGPPSSDDVLPRTVAVDVRAGQATATAAVDLMPASRLRGTVQVAAGTSLAVLVEDADGDVVRRATTDPSTGAFTAGGLPAGSYTVLAVDLDRSRSAARPVVLPAATSTASAPTTVAGTLVPTVPLPTVRGSVPGATGGAVRLRSAPSQGVVLLTQSAPIAKDGTYRLRSVPGRFTPTVEASGRVPLTAEPTTIAASTTLDLRAGARTGTAVARFAVDGHVVRVDLQAKRGRTELLLARASGLRSIARDAAPGRYRWTRVLAPLPAADGPWYYAAPSGTFALRAGVVTRLGTVPISIRGGTTGS